MTHFQPIASDPAPHVYRTPNGLRIVPRLTATDTNGAYSLAEIIVPRFGGPHPHHHVHAETFLVLEGEFEFQIGDTCLGAGPGQTVSVPANIAHAFQNLSARPGRLLLLAAPGGIEEVWKAIHRHPLNLDLVLTARAHGIEFD